jgi:hypothetical protein
VSGNHWQVGNVERRSCASLFRCTLCPFYYYSTLLPHELLSLAQCFQGNSSRPMYMIMPSSLLIDQFPFVATEQTSVASVITSAPCRLSCEQSSVSRHTHHHPQRTSQLLSDPALFQHVPAESLPVDFLLSWPLLRDHSLLPKSKWSAAWLPLLYALHHSLRASHRECAGSKAPHPNSAGMRQSSRFS